MNKKYTVLDVSPDDTSVKVVYEGDNTSAANIALLKTQRGALIEPNGTMKPRKGLSNDDAATIKSAYLRRERAHGRDAATVSARESSKRQRREAPPPSAAAAAVPIARAETHAPEAAAEEPARAETPEAAAQPASDGLFDHLKAPLSGEALALQKEFGAGSILRLYAEMLGQPRHDASSTRCVLNTTCVRGCGGSVVIFGHNGRFHCTKCRAEGDVVDFVALAQGLDRERAAILTEELLRGYEVVDSARAAAAQRAPAHAPAEPLAAYSLHAPLTIDAQGMRLVAHLPEELHQLFLAAREAGGIDAFIAAARPAPPPPVDEEGERAKAIVRALGGPEACARLQKAVTSMGGVDRLVAAIDTMRSLLAAS